MTDLLFNKLLQGDRIYFAGMSTADMETYARWFSNIELQKFTTYDRVFPQTVGQAEQFRQRGIEQGRYAFTIRLRDDDTPLGNISLKGMDWRSRSCSVGIAIGEPDYWGQGYGTEAMQIILRYAFLELNLNRVELEVLASNERAVLSYEKVGFQREALKRQALFRDGRYQDFIVMGILRREWQANQT